MSTFLKVRSCSDTDKTMVLILGQDKEPLGECATAKYNFFISEFVYLQKNNAPKTWLSYNVFLTSPCRLVEGVHLVDLGLHQ